MTGCVAERLIGAACCDMTCIGATLGGELGFGGTVEGVTGCVAERLIGAACWDMTCIGATLDCEFGLGTEVWAIAGFACAIVVHPLFIHWA